MKFWIYPKHWLRKAFRAVTHAEPAYYQHERLSKEALTPPYAEMMIRHKLGRRQVAAAMGLKQHCRTMPWPARIKRPGALEILDLIIEGRMAPTTAMVLGFCDLTKTTPDLLTLGETVPAPEIIEAAMVVMERYAKKKEYMPERLWTFANELIGNAKYEGRRRFRVIQDSNLGMLERVEGMYDYMTTPSGKMLDEGRIANSIYPSAQPIRQMLHLWDDAFGAYENYLRDQVDTCDALIQSPSLVFDEGRAKREKRKVQRDVDDFLTWRGLETTQHFLQCEASRRHIEARMREMGKRPNPTVFVGSFTPE